MEGKLKLTCFDEDVVTNDLIGETTVSIDWLCSNIKESIIVYYHGAKSGEVLVHSNFEEIANISDDEMKNIIKETASIDVGGSAGRVVSSNKNKKE
jgi:hypothetical protein